MIETRSLALRAGRVPLVCQWEITCRCNLRCVMCYTDCFNRPDLIRTELETHAILRIMDELADAGCLDLILTGGEPLARPDFFDIYEHAKARGFLVAILTNGTLITKAVADRLAALPPHRIEISLHGLTEQTFETITGRRRSFERCRRAIRLLLDRGLAVVLKTTAMTVNHDEILAIKRYAQSLGPVGYRLGEELRPTLDGSDAPRRLALTESARLHLLRQDPDLWAESCRRQSEPVEPCESGRRRFHIDAYGQLQLCSGNRQMGYDLRRGSFADGFYNALPRFPCAGKRRALSPLAPSSAGRA
jgi:MoaA/NifB/PqqE/SkfB family radical SAM enzyme